MLTPFFTADPVSDYASARKCDTTRFGRFFRALLERGVYFPPSQFETSFTSLAHSEEDIDTALRAAAESFAALGKRS